MESTLNKSIPCEAPFIAEADLRSTDDTPKFYIVAFERHSIPFCQVLSDRFMLVNGGRVARRSYTEEDTISKFVFISAKETKNSLIEFLGIGLLTR